MGPRRVHRVWSQRDNGCIEASRGGLRDGLLDREVWTLLDEGHTTNLFRRHGSLDCLIDGAGHPSACQPHSLNVRLTYELQGSAT